MNTQHCDCSALNDEKPLGLESHANLLLVEMIPHENHTENLSASDNEHGI